MLIVAGGLIGGYSDTTEVISHNVASHGINSFLKHVQFFYMELQLLDYSNTDSGWREAGPLPSARWVFKI